MLEWLSKHKFQAHLAAFLLMVISSIGMIFSMRQDGSNFSWLMIAIFAACGIVSLVQMEATSMAALSEGKFWSDAIAFVQDKEGVKVFGFWQIVVFAWLCNGAMHFGMADLSIFRFAQKTRFGIGRLRILCLTN